MVGMSKLQTMTITEILSLIDDQVDTNDTKFPLARKIRAVNKALDKLVNLILEKDTLQQWDDFSYSDLAEGYLNLTSGQVDYNIREEENLADLLYVVGVLAKDASGTFHKLRKRDPRDPAMEDQLTEVSQSGHPESYRLSGWKLILDRTPSYSQNGGLKILFIRKPKAVLTTDTTKELPIPSTFHFLVAVMASYDFARAKGLENRNELLAEIMEEKSKLGLHVARQDRDADKRLISFHANASNK